jgi:hypothetical protein
MGNLCQALGIRLIAHKARNARATGSVEKARDILERDFEHGCASAGWRASTS